MVQVWERHKRGMWNLFSAPLSVAYAAIEFSAVQEAGHPHCWKDILEGGSGVSRCGNCHEIVVEKLRLLVGGQRVEIHHSAEHPPQHSLRVGGVEPGGQTPPIGMRSADDESPSSLRRILGDAE